jgi:hypothetical protein
MPAPIEMKVEQYWPGGVSANDMTVKEARTVGRWLCRKADEISPQQGMRAWFSKEA